MRPTSPHRVRPLHLPNPGLPPREPRSPRSRPKRRRPASPLQQLAIAALCVTGAGLILKGLMSLAERFNTLLLVSQAVANLIRGLSLLATGLLQVLALLAVAALALLALLLLVGGLTRLLRLLTGGLGAGAGGSRPAAKAPSGLPRGLSDAPSRGW
ncbi:MAG: hypothetical protein VKO39_07990 [Cyanobacteriota bacterium]|nr:hypothetical protein [Cyanobacteriota bacterium]